MTGNSSFFQHQIYKLSCLSSIFFSHDSLLEEVKLYHRLPLTHTRDPVSLCPFPPGHSNRFRHLEVPLTVLFYSKPTSGRWLWPLRCLLSGTLVTAHLPSFPPDSHPGHLTRMAPVKVFSYLHFAKSSRPFSAFNALCVSATCDPARRMLEPSPALSRPPATITQSTFSSSP